MQYQKELCNALYSPIITIVIQASIEIVHDTLMAQISAWVSMQLFIFGVCLQQCCYLCIAVATQPGPNNAASLQYPWEWQTHDFWYLGVKSLE